MVEATDCADLKGTADVVTTAFVAAVKQRFPCLTNVDTVYAARPRGSAERVISSKVCVDADDCVPGVGAPLTIRMISDAVYPVIYDLAMTKRLDRGDPALRCGVWVSRQAFKIEFFAYTEIYTEAPRG